MLYSLERFLRENSTEFIHVLFLVGLFFLFILFLFYNRLKNYHPHKYEEMGEPNIFHRRSLFALGPEIKFWFTRAHKHMGDKTLGYYSDFLAVFFALWIPTLLYTLLFSYGIIGF